MTDVRPASTSTGMHSQAMAMAYRFQAYRPAFHDPDMPHISRGMIDVMPAMIASSLTQ